MYGRCEVGQRSTATSHEAETRNVTRPSSATLGSQERQLTRQLPATPTRIAATNAGPGIHPTSIFVLKATPTSAPAAAIQAHHLGLSSERSTAAAAPSRRRIKNGSGRFRRFTATEIGVSASTRPATVAATVPKYRRTRSHNSATEAAPATALGSRIDHVE